MIKDIHIVRYRRPGKETFWYVYAWRGGPRVATLKGSRKPRLDNETLRAVVSAREKSAAPQQETLLAMSRAWRSLDPNRSSSPEWEGLSKGTHKTWGAALDLIEAKWANTPLTVWNDPRMTAKVVAWRDSRKATPRSADIGVTTLRALLEFGRLRGMVSINVASKVPQIYKGGQRAEIVWTADDMEAFVRAAGRLGRAQIVDGLYLAALTGLRRADLVSLTWKQVGEFAILKRTLKKSAGKRRHMSMPRTPALDALLDDLRRRWRKPDVETVLVNSFGEPWTPDGFGGSFNRVRDEADICHVDEDTGERTRKHLHDLRGTFCTQLMTETDLGDREIADVMGWSPDRVATVRRIYVDQANVMAALGKRLRALNQPT